MAAPIVIALIVALAGGLGLWALSVRRRREWARRQLTFDILNPLDVSIAVAGRAREQIEQADTDAARQAALARCLRITADQRAKLIELEPMVADEGLKGFVNDLGHMLEQTQGLEGLDGREPMLAKLARHQRLLTEARRPFIATYRKP